MTASSLLLFHRHGQYEQVPFVLSCSGPSAAIWWIKVSGLLLDLIPRHVIERASVSAVASAISFVHTAGVVLAVARTLGNWRILEWLDYPMIELSMPHVVMKLAKNLCNHKTIEQSSVREWSVTIIANLCKGLVCRGPNVE